MTSRFSGRNVLITGGLGFVGSNLAIRLVGEGANITLVDSLIPEYGGNLRSIAGIESQVRLNVSDVRDEYSFAHLVQGQDFLFNLAGQTSHIDSMADPYTDLAINARAQLSILEACRRHNREITIVFASTRQIYGRPLYLPVDEKHPIQPVDINGVNKAAGESFHHVYHDVYGIRSCSLRLTNTYGPRMRVKDARQTFLGVWIRSVLEGTPFEVWGGDQLRDFNFVDDVVDALLRAAVTPSCLGMALNLGDAEPMKLRDVAELLISVNGGGTYEIKDFPAERRAIEIGDYYTDFSKAREVLGWSPRVSFREGLERTLAFFRETLEHYTER
ncbi:MAG TPA: GDP-mannose 4,6-dehydratase [Thermoanaerobaculia bacterium]